MEFAPKRKNEAPAGPAASESQEKKRNLLRRGLLVAAAAWGMFASAAHREVSAAEIGLEESWTAGATKLQQAAQHERNEVSTMYIDLKGGKSAWIAPNIGTPEEVELKLNQRAEAMQDLAVRSGASTVDRICILHTHPGRSGFLPASNRAAAQGNFSLYPPSEVDLGLAERGNLRFRSPALKDANLEWGVFSGQGVFYYRSGTKEELERYAPKEGNEHVATEEARIRFSNMITRKMRTMSIEQFFEHYRATEVGKKDTRDLKQLRDAFGGDDDDLRESIHDIVKYAALSQGEQSTIDRFFTKKEGAELKEMAQRHASRMARSREARQRFIAESLTGKPSEERFKELQHAFALTGYVFRYTEYKDIASEPACAGVDYAPTKK